jgi:diguanylate cyclase (GGDEF)-like protein
MATFDAYADTDALTGLGNRWAFNRDVSALHERRGRERSACSVALFDLDNFRPYNNRHGHASGDRALVEVATMIRATLRPGKSAYRIGGDEFAVILRGLTPPLAAARADWIRQLVEVSGTPDPELWRPVRFTISAGVASLHPEGATDPLTGTKQAAEALRAAKDSGRNRVTIYRSPGWPS